MVENSNWVHCTVLVFQSAIKFLEIILKCINEFKSTSRQSLVGIRLSLMNILWWDICKKDPMQGFPHLPGFHYTKDPTTWIFGQCMCKWGVFALVGDPLQSHSRGAVFFKSQNLRVAGTPCADILPQVIHKIRMEIDMVATISYTLQIVQSITLQLYELYNDTRGSRIKCDYTVCCYVFLDRRS